MRRFRDALQECLVGLERYDRGALIDRCADSAKVVPVMMAGHDESDWLVRNKFLRFRQHRARTRFIIWSIDNDDVILHFNNQTVMRASSQVEDSIPHFLRLNAHWRRSKCADIVRHSN